MKKFIATFVACLLSISILLYLLPSCNKKDTPTPNLATPVVESITPQRDSVGASVTINGSNFSSSLSDNVVKFNALSARPISATSNTLVVEVPNGIPNDYGVTVTTNGQTSNARTFKIVSATQLLLEGKWRYAKSVRVDSEYFSVAPYIQPWPFAPPYGISFDLDTTYNYLKFNSDSTLYSFQSAWGTAQAGRLYKDTVQYTFSGDLILLTFTAGINTESYSPISSTYIIEPIVYNTYKDTIAIMSLTGNSMTIKRNYHYKHYGWSRTTYVKKESIDSLVRY